MIARCWSLALVLVFTVFAAACEAGEGAPAQSGEELGRAHCGTCHAFPEPELLDRATWEGVLSDMGARLGMYSLVDRDSLLSRSRWDGADPDSVYPPDPKLPEETWNAIVDYYRKEAPETLPEAANGFVPKVGLPGFGVRVPGFRFDPPYTSVTEILETHGVYFVGNLARENILLALDGKGRLVSRWSTPGAPVAIRASGERVFVGLIGSGIGPSDVMEGSIQVTSGPDDPLRPVLTGLRRPIDFEIGDLDGDGDDDLVVCEYGHHLGALAWYESTGGEAYRRHVLNDRPGAADAVLHDFDGDGRVDVGVLMAQADEGFDLYLNQGSGAFERRRVLRFPPVYGSNRVELADFNADGATDLLYVNGDNADLSPIPKPYHGVRIFLGDPSGDFSERVFLPMNGAISAEPSDFDGDGDLDIAAIAYFPDYARKPEQSFVLFRNEGDLRFEAFTFEDAQRGRWIMMDAGDFDGDQDPDILLGSNIGFAPAGDQTGLLERWLKTAPTYLILENQR